MTKKYSEALNFRQATVSWSPVDLEELRPNWGMYQRSEWLRKHERTIRDAMVQRGWEVIETLMAQEKAEGRTT
jgi:hypothetical protein